jgi:hypothetical protein
MTRHLSRTALSAVLAATALAAAAASSGFAASAAGTRAAATAAAKPPGYTVVHAGPFTATANAQVQELVACPVKKGVQLYPLSGGASVDEANLLVNMNSSFASGDAWEAWVNNASNAASSFYVYAVCVDKPSGYSEDSGTTVPVAAGGQASTFIYCPSGKQVVGGGLVNPSGSTLVDMGSSLPEGTTRWQVSLNNQSTSPTTFLGYAVCAKYPAKTKYVIDIGNTISAPAADTTMSKMTCPGTLSVLGGGAFASAPLDLGMNWPATTHSWDVYENNPSAAASSFTPEIICAS